MKITAFNASPAGSDSATQVIVEAFLCGAREAGAETVTHYLMDAQVGQCKGCFACWFQTPGRCVQRDDMDGLMAEYLSSDVVVFATPIYTWNYTALLKNFVDRLAPLKSPLITETAGRFDLENSRPKTQRFVVISNCGFPGEENFAVLHASVACCEPSLEIYRNCGKLLKSQRPDIREKVDAWLEHVTQAGREFAAFGQVSADAQAVLEMPLMRVKDYVAYLGMG